MNKEIETHSSVGNEVAFKWITNPTPYSDLWFAPPPPFCYNTKQVSM